ncbi:MAG: hypothetical protein HRU14_09460 [Planctomycetes bacterium]|nr:hypothetical protein [Planctomycetota bacterium]
MAEQRNIWIDQAFSASEYRVRERVGVESETLGVFSTRPQAEDFMDRILNPEKYADEGKDEPVQEATPEPQKKRPTWTRGITPADL